MTPIHNDRPDAPTYRIDRLTGPDTDPVAAAVEPLLREYVAWAADQLTDLGMRFGNLDDATEAHHAAFRAELPKLLGPKGQLLLARLHGEPVGLGALKPVDATTAEIKRMYVRQHARGHGLGRELLEQLLAAARDEDYQVARLETLTFMTGAQALYESSASATPRCSKDQKPRSAASNTTPATWNSTSTTERRRRLTAARSRSSMAARSSSTTTAAVTR
jgi:GNAT superfamily N-acetyltransferase